MLSGLRGSVTDLVIYFSAWSVVFSVYAIWHGRRLIYLLALYLALIGFDVIWRGRAPDDCIPLAPWIALAGEGVCCISDFFQSAVRSLPFHYGPHAELTTYISSA